MRKLIELLTGAALAATVGLASAQMTPPPTTGSPSRTDTPSKTDASPGLSSSPSASGDVFGKLDADHDGMISKKESSKNKDLTAKWDTLDTNKDGKLDQGEFAAFEASSGK